jgi:selenocysteine-specific elongation factor
MRHLIVGTAGHIDHGKSALVKALTGTDPDRLKEEKLRGITIDLGFAHLAVGDLDLGFVDVPGHEKFVKNMLAGVGGIDFVLLVIAGDESIMPQTREHFDICRLLGIQAGIVVVNKIDLVDADLLELVVAEIGDMVKGSFLEGAQVVKVSSKTGEGMERLKDAMVKVALSIPSRPVNRMLRLPVDRAFTMRGFGTVVTGTLTAGSVRRDDEAELLPSGIRAKIRGIQVHGLSNETASAGQRTAVNLQGVDLAAVERGMVLTIPGKFRASSILDVKLNLLAGARPVKNLVKVRFHQGTAEVLARLALLGTDELEPGQSAYAQLRLDSPVFCLHGDTYIIRQFSPAVTIGGGTVLNPHPSKHKTTDRDAVELLRQLEKRGLSERIPAFVGACMRRELSLAELIAVLGIPEAEIKEECRRLAEAGGIILTPDPAPYLLLPPVAAEIEKQAVQLVTDYHRQNPLIKGISREELRKRAFDDLTVEVFRHFLERLVQKRKIALEDEFVCQFGREVKLSEAGLAIRGRIEGIYRSAGFQPPGWEETVSQVDADPQEIKRVYHWMLKEKILVRISEDLTFHAEALSELKNKIRSSLKPGFKFGVAEFKDLAGITRKHAIPLLEYLDRERVTRRQGNERVLL